MENILNERYQLLVQQRQQLLAQLADVNGRIAELQELYKQVTTPHVHDNGHEEQPEPVEVAE